MVDSLQKDYEVKPTIEETCEVVIDTSNPSPDSSSFCIDQLKQMFPSQADKYLQEIISKSFSINDAVSRILQNDEPTSSIYVADAEKSDTYNSTDSLTQYRMLIEPGKQFIEFNRMQMSTLRQLMCIYKNPKMSLKKDPDVSFEGELGADMGGPKNELFSLALQSLSKVDPVYKLQLFGGEEGHFVPLYGVGATVQGCFEIAGKLLAHSILRSCDGLVGLAPAVVEYFVTGSVEKAGKLVMTKDLLDVELTEIIESKVMDQEGIETLTDEDKDKLEEKIVSHGLSDIPIDLLAAEVITTRTSAMDSFFKGLNCLGLGTLLRKHPGIAETLFPSKDNVQLDVGAVKSLFTAGTPTTVSEEQRQSSEWFYQFIDESSSMEDENTGKLLINTLVKFVTGTSRLCPLETYEVSFNTDRSKVLLEADSCFCRVTLPVAHKSYDEYKMACITSLLYGGVGYGHF